MSTDGTAPHFNVHTIEYSPLPEYGGKQAVLYQSDDGKRVAGSFHESGAYSFVMPYDEFIYVIAGTCKVAIEGGESFELGAGGCCYLKEGQNITIEFSEDFHDVSVLVSDSAFNYLNP